MRNTYLALVGAMILACGGSGPPSAAPEPEAAPVDCAGVPPLSARATLPVVGWSFPVPEQVEVTDGSSTPLVQMFWELPAEEGLLIFQALHGPAASAVPIEDWLPRQRAAQEGLGRSVEETSIDLDGTASTALRYEQGSTHGIEIPFAVDGGFRTVTFDAQASDPACIDRARATIDAVVAGLRTQD
jgi:hypothetical protein